MFVNFLQTLVFVGTYCTQICGYSVCQQQNLHNHRGSLENTVALLTTTLNGLTIFLFISILCQCSLVDNGLLQQDIPAQATFGSILAETSTTLYTDAQNVDMTNACRDFNYSIHRHPDHRLTNAVNNAEPNILLKPAIVIGSTGSLIQP